MARGPEHFQFRPGPLTDEVTVERLEALRKAAVASRPAPAGHVGIRILQTPTGWTAQTMEGRRGGEESTLGALVIEQTDTNKVKVTWGAVGGIPAAGVETDATITNSRQVYVTITINPSTRQVTEAAIESGSTMPSPDSPNPETGDPPATHYFLLGAVTFSGGEITNVSNTNGTRGGSLGHFVYLADRICVDNEGTLETRDLFNISFYRQ